MPPPTAKLTKQPVTANNGTAALAITDQSGKPPVSYPMAVTADDGGAVVGLTLIPGVAILATPRAVGTANVTVISHEGGQVLSGVMVATVTLSSGQLHTTWTSGTMAVV